MTDLTTLLALLAFMLAIGAFAGLVAGMLGVGGGIVLVPSFHFAFLQLGYDSPHLMQICLATSLATIVVTSIRSLAGHHRKGAVDWGILRGWAPGIILGAGLAVLAATGMKSVHLMVIFGVLGLLIGFYLAFGKSSWRLGSGMPAGIGRAIASPVLGFLSVLMGIGGGSFGVPMMTLYGVPIHRAVGTAAGFGLLIAVPSVAGFAISEVAAESRPPFQIGMVNLVAFGVIVAMTLLTAPLGVRLAHAMDAKILKRAFAVFILIAALNMLRKAYFG